MMAARGANQVPERTRSLYQLALQYGRFGTVGVTATTVHVAAFVALIEVVEFAPLIANVLAFGLAVLVSFFGHWRWTFRPTDGEAAALKPASRMLSKFVVVALIGLLLNSLVVYAVTDTFALPYAYAVLLMVSIVPLTIFLLSKFWAFA
jgi:putative flippase GtrA